MSKAALDLEYFRVLLLEQQQKLLAVGQTGEAAAQTVELDQTRVGRLSRMDALQAQAMSQAANRRRAATLAAIGVALQRLERGDYGSCRDCGEDINVRRLESDPLARLCIQCAQACESR